jgi:hypothetical protein
MRVVDRQGRLFGRWNLIDVVAGACFLALAPMVYFGLVVAAERRAQIAAAKRPPAVQSSDAAEAAPSVPPPALLSVPPPVLPPVPPPPVELSPTPPPPISWEFIDVEAVVAAETAAAADGLAPGLLDAVASDVPPTLVRSVRDPRGQDHRSRKRRRLPLELIATFRVACRRSAEAFSCPGGPLRLGGPFTFSTGAFSVSGTILALDWSGQGAFEP